MPTQDPEARDLNLVAMFAELPIINALSAGFVTWAAEAFFYQDQQRFRTHVANTLPFRALRALEERSVVELAEVVRDEQRRLPVPIRGRDALLRHRDLISHPMTVRWRKPDRQQAADDGHRWSPIRAGLVWDVLKSINEALRARGEEVRVSDVPITHEMAVLLLTILKLAGTADDHLPPEQLLVPFLVRERAGFIRVLEAHPDGVPPSRVPNGDSGPVEDIR